MTKYLNLGGKFPNNDIDDILSGKPFIQGFNNFQRQYRPVFRLYFFFWLPAVITISAVPLVVFLSKISQQNFSPANTAFCEGDCFVNKLCPDLPFTKWLVSHQMLKF